MHAGGHTPLSAKATCDFLRGEHEAIRPQDECQLELLSLPKVEPHAQHSSANHYHGLKHTLTISGKTEMHGPSCPSSLPFSISYK